MSLGVSILSLTAGALLLAAVTRLAIPPAAWLAFILFLHATRSMPVPSGFLLLFVALYVALATGNRGVIPAPGAAYLGISAFLSLTMALTFAIDRLALGRIGGVGFTLIFPAAFVALELFKSRLTPAATWGSLAYTQYGYLPVMQIAALTGIWGITFAVTWFASTAEWAWGRGFEWNTVRAPVLLCGGVVGSVVLAGAIRVGFARADGPTLRVVTLNRPVDLFVPGEMTRITEGRVLPEERRAIADKLTRLHDWFLDGTRREARAGARVITWPEANLLVFREEEAMFVQRAQRVAAEERVYLAMGIASIQPGARLPFENKLVLIDPSGQIIVNYLKTHPVAGWEASIMQRGDGRVPVVATSAGRIAGAICFDADFPEFIRQAGQERADLLIVPANDWKTVKDLHAQMAAFRAVENGIPIVRAAASGVSAAFDAWGRVLGIADYFAPGDRTMTAQVPIGRTWTLYPIVGDLFAWCCVAALIIAVGVAVARVTVGA